MYVYVMFSIQIICPMCILHHIPTYFSVAVAVNLLDMDEPLGKHLLSD